MASIQFDIGDGYDKKCGEMFLTLKGNIVFHCALCENKYEIFEKYADHILLHYIRSNNIKQEITNEVQPAQLNDDNRVLVPKWRKNKPPPISELMTKLFELDDTSTHIETPSIKQEPIDEIPESMVVVNQANDDVETFDIKVEFSETGFSDNESLQDFPVDQPNYENKLKCIFECPQCKEIFDNSKNLEAHINKHPSPNAELNSKYLKTKKKHLKKSAQESLEVFVCECCGKGYPTSSELQEHIEYYIDVNNKKCTFCNIVFQSCGILHRHVGVHYHERHFECDVCKARFKKERGLHDHKIVHHSEERSFTCKVCGEKFHMKMGLKWHERTKHMKNTQKSNGCLEYMEVDLGSYVDAMTSAALI